MSSYGGFYVLTHRFDSFWAETMDNLSLIEQGWSPLQGVSPAWARKTFIESMIEYVQVFYRSVGYITSYHDPTCRIGQQFIYHGAGACHCRTQFSYTIHFAYMWNVTALSMFVYCLCGAFPIITVKVCFIGPILFSSILKSDLRSHVTYATFKIVVTRLYHYFFIRVHLIWIESFKFRSAKLYWLWDLSNTIMDIAELVFK